MRSGFIDADVLVLTGGWCFGTLGQVPPPTTTFAATILLFGNNTGIEVPPANLAELGTAKRPTVHVDVNGYEFTATLGSMGGRTMISFSKAHRDASGLAGGAAVTVRLTVAVGEREVTVPAKLSAALAESGKQAAFDGASFSARKEMARQVADAKTSETRDRRIAKILASLD